jgi:uncharacterized membrane protein YccC
MSLPTWRDWAFALKVLGAAVLALFIALWIDLPRPYWAVSTVFITVQPLAGATRSKAIYRVCGTVLGAIVAVILVPNLVNAPELLTLAIALWVAICLYVSLLDRTPRSYILMLAGYTAAFIGFPAVADPGAIFDTAVARAWSDRSCCRNRSRRSSRLGSSSGSATRAHGAPPCSPVHPPAAARRNVCAWRAVPSRSTRSSRRCVTT